MRDLLEQIERSLEQNLYYLALFGVLSLPDICGAVDSDNGEAERSKYIRWFEDHVGDRYKSQNQVFLSGEDCYYFRCGILHQGSSQHPKSGYSRILFVEPSASSNVFHCNILNDALNIDVRIFCKDIVDGVRAWLGKVEDTTRFDSNMAKFIRRYPDGLSPYIVGLPVIGCGRKGVRMICLSPRVGIRVAGADPLPPMSQGCRPAEALGARPRPRASRGRRAPRGRDS